MRFDTKNCFLDFSMLQRGHIEAAIRVVENAGCRCEECIAENKEKCTGEWLQRKDVALQPLKDICALTIDSDRGVIIGKLLPDDPVEEHPIVYVLPEGLFLTMQNYKTYEKKHEDQAPVAFHVTQRAFDAIIRVGSNIEIFFTIRQYKTALHKAQVREYEPEFNTPYMSWGIVQDSYHGNSVEQSCNDRALVEFPDQMYRCFQVAHEAWKNIDEVMKKDFPEVKTYYLMIGMAAPASFLDFMTRRIPQNMNIFNLRCMFFRIVLPHHVKLLIAMSITDDGIKA